ncbi:MAG: zinc ribbon domain-containing protein [Clostridia bacterium]
MYKDLSLLLEVQDIDKSLIKKQEKLDKLKEPLELRTCVSHLEEIERNLNGLVSKVEERKRKVSVLERDIRHYQNLTKELDDEIYSGKSNSKELHYLIYEKDKNKETIESSELELMDLLEKNERDSEYITRLKLQKDQMVKKYDDIKQTIEKKENDLLSAKEGLRKKRELLESQISDSILKKYEEKKERLNYKFVCRIDDVAMCTGCHVKLPSRVFKNLTNNEVERCDECGRYLLHIKN